MTSLIESNNVAHMKLCEANFNQDLDKKRLFERFQRYGAGTSGQTTERVLNLSASIGEGYRREILLGPGLKLYLEHYKLRERMTARVVPERFPLGISVCMSGRLNWTPEAPGPHPTYPTRSGDFDLSVSKANTDNGFIECLPHDPILLISLLISPGRMGCLVPVQKMLDSLIRGKGLAQDPSLISYHCKHRLPSSMGMVARQLMQCELRGPAKQIYLTSKALELTALVMDQLGGKESLLHVPDSPVLPGFKEREQLDLARKILDQHFDAPPGLALLARQTGLNQTKLKKGFKQLFNTTVSAYVLGRRMETGQTLLKKGDTTVSEVAFRVGYANRAHFSRAFTRYFGCTPVSVLKRSRRSLPR